MVLCALSPRGLAPSDLVCPRATSTTPLLSPPLPMPSDGLGVATPAEAAVARTPALMATVRRSLGERPSRRSCRRGDPPPPLAPLSTPLSAWRMNARLLSDTSESRLISREGLGRGGAERGWRSRGC